jgi:hypothetical protein
MRPSLDLPVALPADDVATALPPDDVVDAVPVPEPGPRPRRGLWQTVRAVAHAIGSAWEWLFGVVTLMVGLAVLAAAPILGFLSLGYLLEAAGRIARTGRLRDGFIGVRIAARAGSIVLGSWLMLLPLRLISDLWRSAEIVDPGGRAPHAWKIGLTVATILMVIHIVAAVSRGGKLRYFFWPFNPIWLVRRLWRGGYYPAARDATWDFLVSLRLPYYFWLGLRGFAGAFLWLLVPISLLALGSKTGPVAGHARSVGAGPDSIRFLEGVLPLLGTIGALLLIALLPFVLFLQMRFATENRFRAFAEIGAVCRQFVRAPWACAFAFWITLLFALPLYLLKIEIVPQEAAWLPSLVFIAFIFPARLLAGWAYGRSLRRQKPRHWLFGVTGVLACVPVAMFYVLIVYFAQFTAWSGVASLYEQHAFLLPVPFVGL